MPRASRVNAMLDAAAIVTLRNLADGTETATAIETAVSLNELDTAYWHNGEIPHGIFEVNVHVTTLDNTTGDETYVLDIIVDDVSTMNDNPRVVASLPLATKQVGFYKLLVHSKNIPLLDTDTSGSDKFIAIRATLGGTTPIIAYGAWIGRSYGA